MGAGALGSTLGAILSKNNDVLLVTRGKHLSAIRENGLKVEGLLSGTFYLDAERNYPGGYDVIIFTVKAYQTRDAKEAVKKVYSGETVLTFQNGVGVVELLSEFDVVPGSTSMGATLVAPGHVRYAGDGDTFIGELNGELTSRVKEIADNFTECGLNTLAVSDIMARRWIKTAVNACINPLTAVLGVRNGALMHRDLQSIVRCVAEECEAVLRERGIDADVYREALKVIKRTADNESSMYQDIKNRKRTEVDYILGPFVAGNCNRTLYHMVKYLEKKTL
ncbi:MAG: 2-dehydropantoate 2-reductase [Euryarchaeota archaeon]|nr:2-dehydropantoate 2-reductase [Euryarchaeota archaeon]